jgi:protein ImuA
MNNSRQFDALRRRIAALEGPFHDAGRRGALHEVIARDPGAATGFCVAMAARLARAGGSILWCEHPALDAGRLYPPGLLRFGLDPGRLIVARVRKDAEALWTMEEGLRCRGLAAVVGEARSVSLAASRRLQLAAEASGVTALMLRAPADRLGRVAAKPSAALIRWRVSAAPEGRWQAELLRWRGNAQDWLKEWRDATGDFAVAAPVRDRPDPPRARRAQG